MVPRARLRTLLPRRRPGPAAAAKFRGGSVGGVEDGPKGKEEMENRRPRIMNRRGGWAGQGGGEGE